MSPNRTARHEAAPRRPSDTRRERCGVARCVTSPGMVSALAPLVLVAWVTPPAPVDSARPQSAESSRPGVTAVPDGAAAMPEPAPPGAVPRTIEAPGGHWFAHRDDRTGELTVPPPEELEALARRRSAAEVRAAVVERRLTNGAIEIELPEEMSSSPLYGWLDERGELRIGHRPPQSLSAVGAPVRRGNP